MQLCHHLIPTHNQTFNKDVSYWTVNGEKYIMSYCCEAANTLSEMQGI